MSCNLFQVSASGCHGYGGNQLFRLNTEGQLTSGEWCTDADSADEIVIKWCRPGDNSGPWEYKEAEKQIYHKNKKKCLALDAESGNHPTLKNCDNNNSYHKWAWKTITPYWAKKDQRH